MARGGGLMEATERLRRQGKVAYINVMAKRKVTKMIIWLQAWFDQKWVDIGSKKKMDRLQSVEVQNKRRCENGSIQNASHLRKRDE